MQIFLQLLIMTIKQGCLYGVLALGVYITYSILDFPDLSVDGTPNSRRRDLRHPDFPRCQSLAGPLGSLFPQVSRPGA